MIGRGERFCKVGVYLSRDEDGDEDGKFGKRGWWEDQGVKKGERGEGGWCLVVGWLPTYLTCISPPLIPYEMRYMSMTMSMNMNIYENVSLASITVQVQYSLIGFFGFCTTGR